MSIIIFLMVILILLNLELIRRTKEITNQMYWFAYQTDHNLMAVQSQLLQLRGKPSPMPDPDLSDWNKPVPGP